jgi:hypothetical protein
MSAVQMPQGMDPDSWATMSDEEKAGIAGVDYTPAELATMERLAQAPAGSDEDDDDDEVAGADAGGAAAAAASAEKPAGGEAGAEAGTPGEDTAQEQSASQVEPNPVAPVYKASLPEDFNARVEAVQAKEAEVWAKFEAGDLTREELQAELRKVNAEQSELSTIKLKADLSNEMNAQSAQTQWESAVNRALKEFAKPEHGGIDYAKDAAKLADFDQFVKVLANKPENESRSMDWFLQEAHKRVRALHGINAAPAKNDALEQAKERRKPDLKVVPASLAQVPGGDGPGDVGSEFADVDQLEGDALEDAIRAMSPERRQRYAAGR